MLLPWLIAGLGLALASLSYVAGAILCVLLNRGAARPAVDVQPAVTILKPLCGEEIELYENLASFCRLSHPVYQIVFGVRDPKDPALLTVERLQRDFPARDIAVVVDPRIHGTNLKVSNLINMMGAAKHDVLAIADSDIRVEANYLAGVIAPLSNAGVGVVTCAYRAKPVRESLACRLAALQINGWFLPSVFVARAMGRENFCMGSTMAMRRDALAAIGGLDALTDLLADDYMLGALMVQAGYKVELSTVLVETTVPEERLVPALRHELRWARTIRVVEPAAFLGSALMYTLPMALVSAGLLLLGGAALGMALLPAMAALAGRVALYGLMRRRYGMPSAQWWLMPIRDILSFGVWAASFAGRSVVWRGQQLEVDAEGILSEAVSEV